MHRVFSDRREENNARSFDSIDFSETIGLTTMEWFIWKLNQIRKVGIILMVSFILRGIRNDEFLARNSRERIRWEKDVIVI